MNVDKVYRSELLLRMAAKVATVFAVMLLALVLATRSHAAAAAAGPIDSTASGVYLGSDRVCRLVLSRYQAYWVQVDVRCIQFDGVWTVSLTTVYAPNNCPQGGAYMFNPWPPEAVREYLSLISFDPIEQVLLIKRGTDQVAVVNGDALPEWWLKVGDAPSPSPYSCSPSAPAVDPRALARHCQSNPNAAACRD